MSTKKIGLGALLTPEESVLLLIDHQPFQFANLHSHEPTMVINSVVSLYYYVGVVRAMYLVESDDETSVSFPRPIAAAVGVAFVGVVAFGVYPEPFARLADAARLVLAG